TFSNGISISNGCYQQPNGTCILSGGAGGTGSVNSATQNQVAFYNATGNTVSGASLVNWNDTLKQLYVGTTSPAQNAVVTINATSTNSIPLVIRGADGHIGDYFR